MLKLKSGIDKILEWTLIVLMGVSVINVLWQVFTRFILNNPSSYTEELARFLLIWIGVLGASYCVGKNLHLAIDLLPLKLQGRNRQYLELLIQSCVLLFALFAMTVGGLRLVSITLYLQQTSAALQLKLGYVYFVLPLSGGLIIFYALANIVEAFRVPPTPGEERPLEHKPLPVD